MVVGGWVCLLAPLAGFLAILLLGTRITRRQAGFLSTAHGDAEIETTLGAAREAFAALD